MLTRQLDELSSLISRLGGAARQGPAAASLLRELSNRAVLHVLARERLLLPAWREAQWKDLPSDALAAHFVFKRALAELLVLQPGAAAFQEALAAFAAAIRQQKKLDRGRLVPALRRAMALDRRRVLCNDIELFFDAGAPPAAASPGASSSLHELVEEAEIVLSSLSTGWARNRSAPA